MHNCIIAIAAVAGTYDVEAAALEDPSRARHLSQARGLAGLIAPDLAARRILDESGRVAAGVAGPGAGIKERWVRY